MAMQRRAWFVPPAILLAIVAVAWFAGERSPDAPEPNPERTVGDRTAFERLPPSHEEVEALAGRPHLRGSPAASRPAGDERARSLPPSPSETPRTPAGAAAVLRVVLDLPDAWLEQPGEVYALPAGSRGMDDGRRVPRRKAKSVERVDLALPKAGLWDVGYVCRLGHTLALDVAAPRQDALVLDARGALPVTFRVAGREARPFDGGAGLLASLRTPDEEATPSYPGRGERPGGFGWRVTFDESGLGRTPPVPPGFPFVVRVRTATRGTGENLPGVGLVPDRRTAYAGEEVVLRPVRLGRVRIGLSVRGPLPETWRRHWKVDLRAAAEATPLGEGEPRFARTYLRKDGTLKDDRVAMDLPPGRYRLDVGIGKAYLTDTREIRVDPGATVELEAELVPNPAYRFGVVLPGEVAWATQAKLRLEGIGAGTVEVVYPMRDDDGKPYVASFDREVPKRHPIDIWETQRVGKAQVFVHPDRASARFDVPARGDMTVALRPAGCLVLVPEVEPDESLGELCIRRPDGWPIPYRRPGDDEIHAAFDVEARSGTTVGPLLPGEHRFEILLGSVKVGEAKARVRAGRTAPLHLCWLD